MTPTRPKKKSSKLGRDPFQKSSTRGGAAHPGNDEESVTLREILQLLLVYVLQQIEKHPRLKRKLHEFVEF